MQSELIRAIVDALMAQLGPFRHQTSVFSGILLMQIPVQLRSGMASSIGTHLAAWPRRHVQGACIALVTATAYLDYAITADITLAFVYTIPIAISTWFGGRSAGLFTTAFAITLWIVSDVASGLYSGIAVTLINAVIRFGFYTLLVLVLARLGRLQRDLERRSEHRARALIVATAERQRLVREMIDISEREQCRLGRDLHDGLCQHLLATAFEGQALVERLAVTQHPEAGGAGRLVGLMQQAIHLARGLARGLHPVGIEEASLMQALDDFAGNISAIFGVTCRFVCHSPVLVRNQAMATHLYRIAQEAVSNAIKHGHAGEIAILLDESEDGVLLAVSDNGRGFSPAGAESGTGMGLRIMADRANMMGGRFQIVRRQPGMELSCWIPATAVGLLCNG